MAESPYKYITQAIDRRFKFNAMPDTQAPDSHPSLNFEWSHQCLVTQDWDELNEFIYTNEINIPEHKRPEYFDPHSKWSCMLLPKVKIRWFSRVKQVKILNTLYNVIEGTWNASGEFCPKMSSDTADGEAVIKILPYFGVREPMVSTCVLIPFKDYSVTHLIRETAEEEGKSLLPTLTVADETLECVYAAMHFNISFNRQGLYINRKYRDKTEQINMLDLPANTIIIEPAVIDISFKNNQSLLKINLTY
jgi:hypothetical protein